MSGFQGSERVAWIYLDAWKCSSVDSFAFNTRYKTCHNIKKLQRFWMSFFFFLREKAFIEMLFCCRKCFGVDLFKFLQSYFCTGL